MPDSAENTSDQRDQISNESISNDAINALGNRRVSAGKNWWPSWITEGGLWAAMLLPIALYGNTLLQRPGLKTIKQQPIFQGVVYSRYRQTQPRPQVLHLVEIDLSEPGVRPFSTPGFPGALPNTGAEAGQETTTARTSEFLQSHQLQIAINANFFYPFWEEGLLDSGPPSGGTTNVLGIAMSEGKVVSLPEKNWPALCFLSQRAEINRTGDCPKDTQQAVAGIVVLLEEGDFSKEVRAAIEGKRSGKPYAINIVALDRSGTKLWLLIGDGKQPLYSEGMRVEEAADFLRSLGAETALQLDGGGSTTLVIEDENSASGYKILNGVIHAKMPGWERPVANHLGFFTAPLQR